jgi:hypothetical protein
MDGYKAWSVCFVCGRNVNTTPSDLTKTEIKSTVRKKKNFIDFWEDFFGYFSLTPVEERRDRWSG